jgi:hypothetical protein
MGHHHVHTYFVQAMAFGFAAFIPLGAFGLLAGEWLERHRRHHGRSARVGSRRALVSARFATNPE